LISGLEEYKGSERKKMEESDEEDGILKSTTTGGNQEEVRRETVCLVCSDQKELIREDNRFADDAFRVPLIVSR